MSYAFSKPNDSTLEVTCEFAGNASGVTTLLLPSKYANQSTLYEAVEALKCLSHTIEATESPEVKKIHHCPGEIIKISYRITLLTQNLNHDNSHKAIGSKSYFFGTGHSLLIIPENLPANFSLKLDWTHMPKGWALANSFAVGKKSHTLTTTREALQGAVFMAGDFDMTQCGKKQSPIYIAIRGNPPFDKEQFASLAEKIILSQRDFWEDHQFPQFLISVLPIEGENSMGGSGLTHAFSMILTPKMSLSKEEYWNKLVWLLSHEHFHSWNGNSGKLIAAAPEGSMYWFSEGFTEYYAHKINAQNKIISPEHYLTEVNALLEEYFKSSARTLSNSEVIKSFWTDPDVFRLPYTRGFTLALYLDSKIPLFNQKKSLDHFMHDLLALAKTQGGKFTQADWFNTLATYLPAPEIQRVRACINEGQLVPLESCFPNKNFDLQWIEPTGFNIQQSLKENVVRGVKADSQAHAKGLVTGMKITSYRYKGQSLLLEVVDSAGSAMSIEFTNPTDFKTPQLTRLQSVATY